MLSSSCTGKGELIKALLEAYPAQFAYSVSHTTRVPRDGEVDGVQFWFCTEEEMKLDIDRGRYFEHVSQSCPVCHTHINTHTNTNSHTYTHIHI